MAEYVVNVSTRNCSGTKYIVVDYETISVKAGDTIRFQNGLTGNKDAYLSAFNPGGKSGPPIFNFCAGAGAELKIEKSGGGSGEGVCNVTSNGVFQYAIRADDHETLDPVIIVEPGVMPLLPLSDFAETPVGGILTLVLLGGVAAYSYVHGRRVERLKNE